MQVSVICACACVILALAYTARSVTLQQVRRPLVRPKSIPSPTELEALFLVCTSTPLVPLDSAPGRRGNRSDCLVVAQACLLVVHYIRPLIYRTKVRRVPPVHSSKTRKEADRKARTPRDRARAQNHRTPRAREADQRLRTPMYTSKDNGTWGKTETLMISTTR